ncbi:Uncharacterised protein [Salmonella enterica subsp. enterica serovar Bovismorbificans]|uniref:Uncharacterized protein n=1 Tax=Salmonella enterica subsp. enterica serovar Bovismorbificans TaxID=58097 RepID=A0A655EJK0_SALET|nr:Uncharacterised protein [Salmonella enterica subsp. enterica serovar Bovismorbificans]
MQPVTDADALHLLMREDVATGGLINFPFFYVNQVTQHL